MNINNDLHKKFQLNKLDLEDKSICFHIVKHEDNR